MGRQAGRRGSKLPFFNYLRLGESKRLEEQLLLLLCAQA